MKNETDSTKQPSFPQWLDIAYEDWRRGRPGRKSVADFARWLGLESGVVHHYLKGRRKPEDGSKELLAIAKALGPEVYDTLGYPRPELRAAMSVLNKLDESAKEDILTRIAFRAQDSGSEDLATHKDDLKRIQDYIQKIKRERRQSKKPK
jgi:hypothetical protein